MSVSFEFTASTRSVDGTTLARKLRREEDLVPAVLYGSKKDNLNISLIHKDVLKAFSDEAVFSQVLSIKVDGAEEAAVIKSIQRHPYKPRILHIDFLRVDAKQELTMNVPIHLENAEESPGIKAGGVLSQQTTEVEIKCLPADLPESLSIDISELDIGDSKHLSDLALPKGVSLTLEIDDSNNAPIASIAQPKEEVIEDEAPSDEELGKEADPEAAEGDADSTDKPDTETNKDSDEG